MRPEHLRLYLVADPEHYEGDLAAAVSEALTGGVTCVQLRAKSTSDRELLHLARRIRAACDEATVPFIVNDRLDIAMAAKADGIHVGVDDMPVSVIRSLMGPDFIIGYSPDRDDQIAQCRDEGVDYLGVGPVYGTMTKADAGLALGIREFNRRCKISPVPVVGIGGIAARNARDVIEAGAAGVAVVSAILRSPDPREAARDIRRQSGI